MIDPQPQDRGRDVIYIPGHAHGDPTHPDCEEGIIASWNEKAVFVQYIRKHGLQHNAKAASREDLIFGRKINR